MQHHPAFVVLGDVAVRHPDARLVRVFKTPSLRNAVTRPPYMHAGQLGSIQEVLAHYNRAPTAPAGRSELKRLHLSSTELGQIEVFLGTLVSPVAYPESVAP